MMLSTSNSPYVDILTSRLRQNDDVTGAASEHQEIKIPYNSDSDADAKSINSRRLSGSPQSDFSPSHAPGALDMNSYCQRDSKRRSETSGAKPSFSIEALLRSDEPKMQKPARLNLPPLTSLPHPANFHPASGAESQVTRPIPIYSSTSPANFLHSFSAKTPPSSSPASSTSPLQSPTGSHSPGSSHPHHEDLSAGFYSHPGMRETGADVFLPTGSLPQHLPGGNFGFPLMGGRFPHLPPYSVNPFRPQFNFPWMANEAMLRSLTEFAGKLLLFVTLQMFCDVRNKRENSRTPNRFNRFL